MRSIYLDGIPRRYDSQRGIAERGAAMEAESTRDLSHIIYHNCWEKGHRKRDCRPTCQQGKVELQAKRRQE